ncbi:DHA2 family lincomycin resistance protein-like MFS transporter [Murinocardiopsis flavida]|uniref:DHA2 family lincomycin resistance protein-like MFS transporter n=1 Tax=Murinocardiopsis flavida TaxID=645275 RepID=A0A2P8DRZ6_9ACTN|nr:MDR family MFS transporter [Murinocardiopsis flavida]PSK99980.1 DHA2 family lincomycin resistance protein-like MFS transporter [Murinocardiopsis flavida]
MSGQTASVDGGGTQRGTDRFVIPLLLVSAFVVILNETIMSVALPVLNRDLHIPVSTGQWLTSAFMLVMAVVIPITGFLLQRFTLRQVFVAAMTLFSAGTLLCFLAPGFAVLLTGRIVQAGGTAIMMPLLMTTVLTMVPADRRGRTMGNISIVMSVAPALGPTISGFILNALDWRWMFGLVLPIALLGLTLGVAFIRNVTEPRPAAIDLPSVVVSAFAFGGLVYGFSALGGEGAGSALVPAWLAISVGAVALVVFVARQLRLQRAESALLDLRVFGSAQFSLSIALVGVSFMALFGAIILLPIYIQDVLGLNTLVTGLAVLPGGLVMGLIAPLVGRLFDRYGPRPLVAPGAAAVALVLWGMTLFGPETPIYFVVATHMVLSAGLGFMFTPLLTGALGSLRPELYSHGSAVVGTVQQIAGAAGTAAFIAIMSSVAAGRAAEGASEVAAQAGGIHVAFIVGAAIGTVAFAATFFVRRSPDQSAAPGVPAA